MNELLEKAYICYLVYLNHLNYGKVTQNDCLLYDAILYLSNNLNEEQYYQYFVNNLNCRLKENGENLGLDIIEEMDRLILWTLNASATVLNTFDWHTIEAPQNGTFPITTNTEVGYRYFYLSIPQGVNLLVYNELDMQLYDSLAPVGQTNQLFSLVGTMTTENGQTNNVYRKSDMYNATNPVLFKVKIY